ncbi:hypothetical protein A2U01_0119104, partial [Trifolium medium]|nr:hypothetical protein [Trifolium medium]
MRIAIVSKVSSISLPMLALPSMITT